MTRLLVLIAVIGFIVSVVCFGGAVALGGNAIHNGWAPPEGWHINVRDNGDGDWDITDDEDDDAAPGAGAETRELTWDGSDHLTVNVRADIRYIQAPGAPRLTVAGPRGTVENVQVSNGRIRYAGRGHHMRRVTVTLTAPNVTRFDVNGSNRLTIEGYHQDSLDIDASGSTRISVRGQARTVSLDMSGSGQADMSGLTSEDTDVDISGSARATIAPTQSADIDISGSGEVTLTSHPARQSVSVSGSGRIIQGDPEAYAQPDEDEETTHPAPPATPTPPARPAPAAPPRK